MSRLTSRLSELHAFVLWQAIAFTLAMVAALVVLRIAESAEPSSSHINKAACLGHAAEAGAHTVQGCFTDAELEAERARAPVQG